MIYFQGGSKLSHISGSLVIYANTLSPNYYRSWHLKSDLWEIMYGKPRRSMQIPLLKFLDAARKKWWITSM